MDKDILILKLLKIISLDIFLWSDAIGPRRRAAREAEQKKEMGRERMAIPFVWMDAAR